MAKHFGWPYLELHKPVINTDGGPWATHDYVCAVCQTEAAVLDLNTGHFEPCWKCQQQGWQLKRKKKWFR